MTELPHELTYACAYDNHKAVTRDLIERFGARTVCDIGGGREPIFDLDEIAEMGLDYTVLDISAAELDRAPDGYRKVVGDIAGPRLVAPPESYDFMFSRFLAEHVKSGETFHRNVHRLLRPGGVAFHFFPTLWQPPFVANKLMPEALARKVFYSMYPADYPKFPARYSWCYGPSARMTRFLHRIGFDIVEFRPFYGTYYFRKFPGVRTIDNAVTAWAARTRNPHLTAYAYLVVRKPGGPHVDIAGSVTAAAS